MTTEMTFNINGTDRNIQFVGGETLFRVWITGEKGNGVMEIHDHNIVKGILHAFTDMAIVHRYQVHTDGLHLRPSLEKLAGEIVMEDVGYVSNHYTGPIPVDGLEKLDDENPLATNWGSVSFKNGRLYVTRKMWYVPGTKTESDEIKHWRNAINLMSGFEILAKNCSLNLWPKTKDRKSESTGEVTEGKAVIDHELNTALQILSAPDAEQASVMIGQRVANKQVRTSFARLTSAATRAIEEGKSFEVTLKTVGVITDRATMSVEYKDTEVLAGMMGYLFKGIFPVGGLQPLDTPVVMGMIKQQNLRVLFATE